MEFFLYKKTLIEHYEKNDKQTWSKEEMAHISSMNECHKIDTSSRGRKTVDRSRKRWTTLYEDRNAWSRITTWVRASKWGTTYGSASKRGNCVSTQMQSQKKSSLLIAQDTQQKLRVAFSYLECNYVATNEIPNHFILWIRIFPLSVIPLFPFSQINCLILTV